MKKLLMLIGLIALAGSTVRLFLYKSSRISQSEPMRLSLLGLAFLALATASYAQEQERKLVDRLLSPNTKLANPDQNKKFAGGSEAPTRSAATKSFYVSEKNLSKTFVADRSASDDFVPHSQLFDPGRGGANFAANANLSDQTGPRYFPQRLLNKKIRHARFCRQPAIPRTGQKSESVARPGPATHD